MKDERFSKTVFIVISFLCLLMIILAPIIGIIAGKVIGAMALGWIISGILMGILITVVYEQKLNDDFKWKYSKDEPKELKEPNKEPEEKRALKL
jgi:uncharacterized membrane protein (DUF485 family)